MSGNVLKKPKSSSIEDVFGEIYTGLEKASDGGVDVFEEVVGTKKLKKQVADLAQERIEIPSVEIDGEMTILVPGENGIDVIKKALSEGLVFFFFNDTATTEIYTLGSPRYKLRIVSPDYKEAEDILSDVYGLISKQIESSSGTITFLRK